MCHITLRIIVFPWYRITLCRTKVTKITVEFSLIISSLYVKNLYYFCNEHLYFLC